MADGSSRTASRMAALPRLSRDSRRRLLELLVLTGFAIAQPLLDVTGRAPEFFVFRRASRTDVVLFVLIVTVVPSLALWLVEQIARLAGATARHAVHLGFEALMLAAIEIQVSKKLFADRGYSLLLAALVVGTGAAIVLGRSAVARSFLRYLTPAPLVFALLFVLTTPSGQLVTGSRARSQAATGQAQAQAGARPPIVMIFFDEFPTNSLLDGDGQIAAGVFPNFARLAQRSTWFRQATGVSGATTDAVPAMLTGRYPTKKLAAIYDNYPDNLFSLLADDYVIQAAESISEMCPRTECGGSTPPGRATGLVPVLREAVATGRQILSPLKSDAPPPGDQFAEEPLSPPDGVPATRTTVPRGFKFKEARAANNPERLTSFVASLEPSSQPTLHFLHILLPHITYRYLPSGATYRQAPREAEDGVHSKPGEMPGGAELNVRQRYMLQLAYTDRLLGQVIDKLDKSGLWDEALVVVTADHGRGFNRGKNLWPSRRIGGDNEHEVAYVPLFVKVPDQKAGVIDDRNWEHVDLLPTIADVLDYQVPWKLDGSSELGPVRRTRDEKYWYNSPGKRKTFSAAQERPLLLAGVLDLMSQPGAGPDQLFRWGPYGALVGKKVSEFEMGPPSPATAAVNTGPRVMYEAASGEVPAMLWGAIAGVPTGTPIAVAVNGSIGAVPIVIADRKTQLAAMLAESLFLDGTNTIELFVVEGDASRPLLRPVAVSKPSAE